MAVEHVVAVGGSAGAIDVVRLILGQLPGTFPAAVLVVIHTSAQSPGVLDDILGRASPLPVTQARQGQRLRPGYVYVAPPDRHIVLEPGVIRTTKGPRENRFRPAIDPLFRSAAQVYGPRAIGVIVTGQLDDGTAGLWAIKQLGGVTIVQDPHEAEFPSMPQSASEHVKVDYVVPLVDIAPLLLALTSVPVYQRAQAPVPRLIDVEVAIAKEEMPWTRESRRWEGLRGTPARSVTTCRSS
jgi:two-component system chemotaxis response regulator CheB